MESGAFKLNALSMKQSSLDPLALRLSLSWLGMLLEPLQKKANALLCLTVAYYGLLRPTMAKVKPCSTVDLKVAACLALYLSRVYISSAV